MYRMTQRSATPVDQHRHYPSIAPRCSPVAAAIAMRTVRDHRDRDLARWARL